MCDFKSSLKIVLHLNFAVHYFIFRYRKVLETLCQFIHKYLNSFKNLYYSVKKKKSKFLNCGLPLIIPTLVKFQKKVSSTSNNSRTRKQAKLYWYTRQIILVFFISTVKKFTKNFLGPFQMRKTKKKLMTNRSGNASIIHFMWSIKVTGN